MTGVGITSSHWYRVLATNDLDTCTFGFSIYDMGTGHPGLDTSTPGTSAYTISGLSFADAAIKSISSIGLCAYGVAWHDDGSGTEMVTFPERAGCFDNIRIFHNGDECYVNDFSSRRYRILAEGTTSAIYVADCAVTNSVGTETYSDTVNESGLGILLVPPKVANGTDIEPVGVDGWRRVHIDDSGASNTVQICMSSATGNDPVMRFSNDNGSNSGVACPIGSTLSNGTVRMVADMRVPSSWNPTYSRLWVTLGNDTLYNGYRTACMNGRFAHVGIGADSSTNGLPRYVTSSGTVIGEYKTKMSTWYRVELEASLDAGTFSYVLYEQGSYHPSISAANGLPVFAARNIQKMNSGVNTISTLALWSVLATAYFDNIQIWHTMPGAAEMTLLYYNTMRYRNVYPQGHRMGTIAGNLRYRPEGQDGWKAINIGTKNAIITDGENPAMSFDNGDYGYAVHDLGQTVDAGSLVAQIDIRPPRGWMASNGCLYLRLGGDKLFEGAQNDDANFFDWVAAVVGFKSANAAKDQCGVFTNVTLVAYAGDGSGGGSMSSSSLAVDPSHWYRFVVKARMDESVYDLSVYDMGASQPTLATPRPAEPVATFANLTFRRANAALGGVSCMAINATHTWNNALDTSLQPYFDNIRVKSRQTGSIIHIR